MDVGEIIRSIVKSSLPLVCDIGIVTKVDEGAFTCDVDIEGKSPIEDVRLFCGDIESEKKGGGINIIPEVGSTVALVFLSPTIAFLLQCSKAKKIVFNGGEFGGLVKIQELTDKINELVDAFNQHTHTVATKGTAAAQSGTAAVITSPFIKLDKANYEDENIIH